MIYKFLISILLLTCCGVLVLAWCWRPSYATHQALISAELPAAVPLRDFYANQDSRYGWGLSPDGRKLSWLEIEWFRPVLRIKSLEDGKITSIKPPKGFLGYSWSADKKTLLFTLDAKGWEYQKIAAIDTSQPGAQMRIFDFGEQTTAFIYHIPKQASDEVIIAHNGVNPAKFEIYRLNVLTGETQPFGVQAEQEVRYVISDSGEIIARTVFADVKMGNWSLQVQDERDQWEEIAAGDYTDTLLLSGQPNSDGTIFAISNRGRDKKAFVRFNLRNGGETPIMENDIADMHHVLLDPKSNQPLLAVAYPDYQKRYFLSEAFGNDLSVVSVPENGSLHVIAQSEDSLKLLVQVESPDAGFTTVLVDRETGNAETLNEAPIAEHKSKLSPVEPVSFKALDGLEIKAFLSRPKGVSGKAPLVILVHGGPISHTRWGYNEFRSLLNNRGYAVLDVNYRGSTGYGRAFVEVAKGEIAGKMSSDLIDARAWAIEQGFADPDKVAIFGGSWGGFEVLTALSQNSDLFAAGISINGVADLSTMLDEVPDFWRGWREWLTEYGADPNTKEGREYLLDKSPITHASKITTPLLIVQGTNDARVVQGQSDRMIEQLRKANAPVEYELVDGVGHLLGSWSWQKRYLLMRQVEYFLAEHLGGRTGGYDYALIGAHVLPE